MSGRVLFHGGMPGLRVGAVIVPDMQKCRLVDGCPTCAAQAANIEVGDPSTPAGWVDLIARAVTEKIAETKAGAQ